MNHDAEILMTGLCCLGTIAGVLTTCYVAWNAADKEADKAEKIERAKWRENNR